MNYWWVNHKQTARQEIGGGYLWSPKRERNGNRSRYYEFMREARPGDQIVSFADAKIEHAGVISGFPSSAPKPSEFGAAGENWAEEGWYVPVLWERVTSPFRPKDHIDQILPFLPAKYAPIQSNGNGNQKAYLTKIEKPLIELLGAIGGFVTGGRLSGEAFIDTRDLTEKIEDEIERKIDEDDSLDASEKSALIRARRGQGKFRRNVQEIENFCRVSGLQDPRLLVASHIKPWRNCETASERLDGNNGLFLAPHADKLFDIGLISFESDGRVLVSDTLNCESITALHLNEVLEKGVGEFSVPQGEYLKYHRREVFLGKCE